MQLLPLLLSYMLLLLLDSDVPTWVHHVAPIEFQKPSATGAQEGLSYCANLASAGLLGVKHRVPCKMLCKLQQVLHNLHCAVVASTVKSLALTLQQACMSTCGACDN